MQAVSTRTSRFSIALALAVALFAAGCSKSGSEGAGPAPGATGLKGPSTVIPVDEGQPRDGGKMVFGVEAEPDGFDPTSSQFATPAHFIVSSILEPLASFDANRSPQPYLAASIVPNDLASRWTITIKPNITFHDGTPLDAKAVKANLDAQKGGIAGVSLKPIESIEITGDLVVEVKMNQPWASFPSFLAGQPGYQISPATIGKEATTTHPVGTGPFVFDQWERGTKVAVKKFPNYWQAGKPHLDALDFKIINDPSSRSNSLASGELDMITTDQPTTIAEYQAKPDYKVIVDSSGAAQVVLMNEAAPPFDNKNARQALVLATDAAALAEQSGPGVLKPIDQPFAEGGPYHQADPRYPKHDLDAAKAAVGRYTAETGKPLEVKLTINAGLANLQQAQVLQEQWSKAGIKTEIKSEEQATVIKELLVGDIQASLAQNSGYPDPDFNYISWHSSFAAPLGALSINFPHMKIDELDQVLAEGRASLLPEKRQAAYKRATQLINDNLAYAWLYRYVGAIIATNRVHGLRHAETTGFTSFSFKSWFPDLWMDRA